jgi:hypothetical protein
MSNPKKMQKFMAMKVAKVRFQRGGLELADEASCPGVGGVPEGIVDLVAGAKKPWRVWAAPPGKPWLADIGSASGKWG